MARIPYAQPKNRDQRSTASNIGRALANAPELAPFFGKLVMHLRHDTKIDPRLRELAILQVGYVTKTEYEWVHHVEEARKVGVSDAEIRAIADETAGRDGGFDPLARAVLKAAREMTTDIAVSDATYAVLQQHLDNERMVELFMSIATYNAVVRFLSSIKIDLEDDCRHILTEFPLGAN